MNNYKPYAIDTFPLKRNIWIKPKHGANKAYLITEIEHGGVFIHGDTFRHYEDLLENWLEVDGTPCGVLEEKKEHKSCLPKIFRTDYIPWTLKTAPAGGIINYKNPRTSEVTQFKIYCADNTDLYIYEINCPRNILAVWFSDLLKDESWSYTLDGIHGIPCGTIKVSLTEETNGHNDEYQYNEEDWLGDDYHKDV
jgi:hypothetical protein